jgi:hypothetical protein
MGNDYTPGGTWDDDIDEEALARLVQATDLEGQMHDEKTNVQLAEQILQDAAPAAAQSIVRIALTDPVSRLRLTASQFVLDRVIGKSGQTPTENDPWAGVFDAVMVERARGQAS